MAPAIRVQIVDEAVWISHDANTIGKGINPIILPSTMSKSLVRMDSLTSLWHRVEEKENSVFKPDLLHLENDHVLHSARDGEVGKIKL